MQKQKGIKEKDMPLFPFMVDISNKRCLIIGGGKVALHKVEVLLPFGVDITVLADACEPELIELLARINVEHAILAWKN